MKSTLTVLLLAVSIHCYPQNVLIPYRSGNQTGLADIRGKIVIAPQFDYVSWMQGEWFETGKKKELNDTLEISKGHFFKRNSKITLTGLIRGNKIILEDEPFDDYEIVAGKCIVAKYQGRPEELTREQFKKYGNQRKIFSLFNLKGENLYPGNFSRIQKVDTTGTSTKDKRTARYILFLVGHFNEKYSIIVFDADEQKISEWLVKEAAKIEGDRTMIAAKQIGFTITDGSYNTYSTILDYADGKFVLTNTPAKPAPQQKRQTGESIGMAELTTESPGYDVAVPPMNERAAPVKPAFNPYHIRVKDSLFYLTGQQEKHPVNLAAGANILLMEPRGMTQYQPVIVKNREQFYIVKDEKLSTAVYDSLIYFGKYFLAWQHINGQSKAGVIDADGKPVITMEYDSLYADIKYFNLKDMNPGGKSSYQVELKEADSKYDNNLYPYKRSFSNLLTVFKNGQCGIINIKGETIVPLQYELIARNNLQHMGPREDEFILIRQNNKYGMANFKYSKGKSTPDFVYIASPVFNYIPGFYYRDYFGIKDFRLFGLYNNQFEFMGYASEKGTEYFKD